MTPFLRWLRRAGERLLGTFHEGPEPPDRLREMVLLFANANPLATRQEWVEFAAGHAAQAYQSGYVRGWERSERDAESQPWRELDPDEFADKMSPGWRASPSVLEGDTDLVVGSTAPTAEELTALLLDQTRSTHE